MRKLCVGFLALIVSRQALPSDQWAVAMERTQSTACCSQGGVENANIVKQHVSIMLETAEVVHVLRQDGNKLLTGRDPAEYQAWFDKSHFVREASFRQITDWKGQPEFDISSEDGGTKRIYHIAEDGAFSASEDSDGDSSDPKDVGHSTWVGHIYRYKHIVWLKREGDAADSYDKWNVLRLEQDGTACFGTIQASQVCN